MDRVVKQGRFFCAAAVAALGRGAWISGSQSLCSPRGYFQRHPSAVVSAAVSAAIWVALLFTLVALIGCTDAPIQQGVASSLELKSTSFSGDAIGGESTLGIVEVGVGGLVFCLSLWYTKSLWWAIGFHAGWDWGQSYVYGTPDRGWVMQGHLLASHPSGSPLWSGGTAGPEGSLLILPFVTLMAAGMWMWWGVRKRTAEYQAHSD